MFAYSKLNFQTRIFFLKKESFEALQYKTFPLSHPSLKGILFQILHFRLFKWFVKVQVQHIKQALQRHLQELSFNILNIGVLLFLFPCPLFFHYIQDESASYSVAELQFQKKNLCTKICIQVKLNQVFLTQF